MSSTEAFSVAVELAGPDAHNQAEFAAAAFLARYSGRTLEAYRYDLRSFFQWAADVGLEALCATRPHIELFRSGLEARGLTVATIDRRLSTVCGFYRFGHIDGQIVSNPAQYTCAARLSTAPRGGVSTAPSSAGSSSPPSTSTTPMKRSPSSSD